MTKIAIVGAGLGGLLTGAPLAKKGHSIEIYEKLPVIGGRFRNLDHNGYQLSTGAVHTVPHSTKGPFGTLLRELNSNVEIIDYVPRCIFQINNEEIHITKSDDFLSLFRMFSLGGKIRFLKFFMSLGMLKEPTGDISANSWLNQQLNADFIIKMADHFCDWSVNQNTKQIVASEFVALMKSIKKYGGPGIIKGGCQSVTDELKSIITSNGGKIHVKEPITKIITNDDSVTSLKTTKNTVAADVVISDIGPKETYDMMVIKNKRELGFDSKNNSTSGLKFNLGFKKQVFEYNTVYVTCDCEIISGFVEVTNADPGLAPKNRHLIITHQAAYHKSADQDIMVGQNDLKNIFGKRQYELLLIQSYKNGWPVNRSFQGIYIKPKTELENLYLVGDGVKGKGGIEIEGISMNVKNVVEDINARF